MSGGHIAFSERIHGESSRSLPNDATCLRNQIAQLREQLAKAEAEAKRYREAWASVRNQWGNEADIAAGWNVPSGDRLASLLRQCIDDMDDLIPPTEQGTNHD